MNKEAPCHLNVEASSVIHPTYEWIPSSAKWLLFVSMPDSLALRALLFRIASEPCCSELLEIPVRVHSLCSEPSIHSCTVLHTIAGNPNRACSWCSQLLGTQVLLNLAFTPAYTVPWLGTLKEPTLCIPNCWVPNSHSEPSIYSWLHCSSHWLGP